MLFALHTAHTWSPYLLDSSSASYTLGFINFLMKYHNCIYAFAYAISFAKCTLAALPSRRTSTYSSRASWVTYSMKCSLLLLCRDVPCLLSAMMYFVRASVMALPFWSIQKPCPFLSRLRQSLGISTELLRLQEHSLKTLAWDAIYPFLGGSGFVRLALPGRLLDSFSSLSLTSRWSSAG